MKASLTPDLRCERFAYVDHPIRRYCEKHGITQVEFALLVGLSVHYVRQIIGGAHVPGRRAAMRIVEKTGGEIALVELLTWERAA